MRRRVEVAARRLKKVRPNPRVVVRLEPGVLRAVLQVVRLVVPQVARRAVRQAPDRPRAAQRKAQVRDAAADVAAGKRLRPGQPTRTC
jgi:hypothetical protein